MAGNDWINSYLEAILDAGGVPVAGAGSPADRSSLLLRERGGFSPARFFVEEVITGFDETDLYKTWLRALAMRSPQERNARLENMSWRIWNLARKKKEFEKLEGWRLSKSHSDIERARKEATADMTESLFDGDKGDDHSVTVDGNRVSFVDAVDNWNGQHKDNKLYIVLISLHGLVRGENMELGRDADTGGQVKYVVELAKALGSDPSVYRVELLTRQISTPAVDSIYGEQSEILNVGASKNRLEKGENSGAFIIRIPFGPRDKYLPKEHLWPFVHEFVDRALRHIIGMSKKLGDEIGSSHPVWPLVIHGHYASAGISAALLSGALNVPMVFTGHFLGRDKLDELLKQGKQTREEINNIYKITRRIEAEELALDVSEIVIASTRQEIEEQWNSYYGFDVVLARKLRARIKSGASCFGRFMPRMIIIPPGVEFGHIIHEADVNGDEENPSSPDPPIWSEVTRFFTNPRKPMILAIARPYPEKNLTTLVKAFGECRPLRELANLTLILGNRDTISKLPNPSAAVLTSVLTLIDEYDLYGIVAYPKHHKHSEIPDIYRVAAKTKGVFVNVAFFEQFGVTLIEAALYGLPTIATKNGAAVEINQVLDNGLLVDPHDQNAIADALYKLLTDKPLWSKYRENGLKNIHQFSWAEHCKNYVSRLLALGPRHPRWQRIEVSDKNPAIGGKVEHKLPLVRLRKRILVIAVDSVCREDMIRIIKNTMEAAGSKEESNSVGFVLSTSLTIPETHSLVTAAGLQPTDFDAFICNSGSDLYYPAYASDPAGPVRPYTLDRDYHSQIEYRWGGADLRKTLVRWASSITEKRGKSEVQVVFEDEARSTQFCAAFKVTNPDYVPPVKDFKKLMRTQALRCHIIYTHDGTKLHVIPVLASRAQAMRYLYVRWGVELTSMVVIVGETGDSDYEELLGGLHSTVILTGSFNTLPNRIHAARRYPLQDVVELDSSNIVQIKGCGPDDMKLALRQLGALDG